MGDNPEPLDQLAERLEALEQRVYRLEHPSEAAYPAVASQTVAMQAEEAGDAQTYVLAGGAFPVLGKAMLGIAGAYLLRALAESGTLPRLAVAYVGIVYAILWLVAAARVPDGRWLGSIPYACTSALILAPMLWELTLSFHILTSGASAAVLAVFVAAATALAWKRNLTSLLWVANGATAAVALGLSIATNRLTPFLATLLLMALICEAAVARGRTMSVRPLVAAAADAAVWGLVFVYSSPESTRPNYPVLTTPMLLAPGFALLTVYASGVVLKTMLRRQDISLFEILQTVAVFLLAASGLLEFVPSGGETILGWLCLLLAAAVYVAAEVRFSDPAQRRNRLVFGVWSALLLVAGSLLCLPGFWAALSLGTAAIAAVLLSRRPQRNSLEFHGLAFLLAAGWSAGLYSHVYGALAGTLPDGLGWSVAVVSACALLFYALGKGRLEEPWATRALHLVSAALAVAATAALLVEGLVLLAAPFVSTDAPHLAFARTVTMCGAALAMAFAGSRGGRTELTWLGYGVLGLVAIKVVFEDLRHGHLALIAAALFLFAATLIAVPRIARMGKAT